MAWGYFTLKDREPQRRATPGGCPQGDKPSQISRMRSRSCAAGSQSFCALPPADLFAGVVVGSQLEHADEHDRHHTDGEHTNDPSSHRQGVEAGAHFDIQPLVHLLFSAIPGLMCSNLLPMRVRRFMLPGIVASSSPHMAQFSVFRKASCRGLEGKKRRVLPKE